MPSLHLWAGETACKHLAAAQLQENQKPATHLVVLSYKAEDSAAITQAKQLELGNHFLLLPLSENGYSL